MFDNSLHYLVNSVFGFAAFVFLLRVLVQRPGRIYARDELLRLVWDETSDSFDRTVDAHVKTLRAKLKAIAPGPDPIRTSRGAGYALNEDLPTQLA